MTPPITMEFLFIAVAVGVGCSVGCFMAARRNERMTDYAYLVRDTEVPIHEVVQMAEQENSQLSFEDAVANRNAVLDELTEANLDWVRQGIALAKQIPDGSVLSGEALRLKLIDMGLPEPKHNNSWGGLTGALARRKVIVPTGERVPMRQKSSHGRSTPLYRKQTPEQVAA